ncbi:pyridoxamine 5'-phosphate oxidase family protein [Nonomuraea sp. SBT364]|uniref:pyridoxamine 5'-phosphate oxidase family protein n=1 Tax=Nonomuraea sp. SBT364 TaxID=1580530 RepID=UPI00066DB909|nr:pyridoxamine 5'-phosphate oxidase family protein [Nonomuraea sp. SBT364]
METHLDERFSVPGATATPWEQARDELARAETYWLSTVRADGRPHVTPLIAIWHEGALYFSTGPEEQKARNLETNRQCALTTGASSMSEGLDLVVEGVAAQVSDPGLLQTLADAHVAKYGEEWRYEVRDGAFHHEGGGRALVFEVAPVKVLGFRKGDYAQTRWRF